MRLSVSEAARLTGISGRTLRWYDEIGLLKPAEVTPAGYRYYHDADLETLQQILFYRELGVELEQIKVILHSPDHDRTLALQKHRKLLLMKRQRLDDMLRLVDETLGGKDMKDERPRPARAELEAVRAEYAREAEERWGKTAAYRESQEKHKGSTPAQEDQIQSEMESILRAFGRCGNPASTEAQDLVRRWQEHITKHHYNCTDRILAGLGEMYVVDQRFQRNLNQYGACTAQIMHDAIRIYCGQNESGRG